MSDEIGDRPRHHWHLDFSGNKFTQFELPPYEILTEERRRKLMNFEDFDGEEALNEAREKYGDVGPIELIFCRQLELIKKYQKIEEEIIGIHLSTDSLVANLDHARDQHLLKARAWWITEELMEALSALYEYNDPKYLEELVDALHFATELCILSGIGPIDIEQSEVETTNHTEIVCNDFPMIDSLSDIVVEIAEIVRSLGMTMWQLRNKPWKQTQIPTDQSSFEEGLIQTYRLLLDLIKCSMGGELIDVAVIYLRKSLVNKFRIRSKY